MEPKETKTPKNSKKFTGSVVGLFVVVLIAIGSFYWGVSYQKGKQKEPSSSLASTSFSGGGFGGRGFRGGNRVIGQVTAVSSSSISVQDNMTGTVTTLAITSSTVISNSGQSATASSIQVGDTVFVSENSTNTTQASRILVNPTFGGGPSSSPSSGSSPSTVTN